jgi:hypothetical protein
MVQARPTLAQPSGTLRAAIEKVKMRTAKCKMKTFFWGEETSWRLSGLTLLREAITSRHVPRALNEA